MLIVIGQDQSKRLLMYDLIEIDWLIFVIQSNIFDWIAGRHFTFLAIRSISRELQVKPFFFEPSGLIILTGAFWAMSLNDP